MDENDIKYFEEVLDSPKTVKHISPVSTSPDGDMVRRAIVLDGGGVRGIFTAEYLKCLEKYLIEIGICKTSIHDAFDTFVGTSTGGIIAAALATGKYTAAQIADEVYSNENAKKIFSSKQNVVTHTLLQVPKYNGEPRFGIGRDTFGDIKLHDLPYKVIIPTYNFTKRKPCFWTNIGYGPNPKVIDVAMATSAAPTYFPAETVYFDTNAGDKSEDFMTSDLKHLLCNPEIGDGYIDGGVCCNSPSTIAYAYLNATSKNKFQVLSIGTGADLKPIKYEDAKNAGGMWWLLHGDLISITMDSSDQVNQIESELIQKENFLRVNLTKIDTNYVSLELDNTDDENMEKLRYLGREMFKVFKEDIDKFLPDRR
jgi:patatin-like phospholipase/acyl hydrolase